MRWLRFSGLMRPRLANPQMMIGTMGHWPSHVPEARPCGIWNQRKPAMRSCSSTYTLHDLGWAVLASEGFHGACLTGELWVLVMMFVSTEKSCLAVIIFIHVWR